MRPGAFEPIRGANFTLVGVVDSIAISGSSLNSSSDTIRIVNEGPELVHVRLGDSQPLTASDADTPVLAGESIILVRRWDDAAIAFVSSGLGATVHFQLGSGGHPY